MKSICSVALLAGFFCGSSSAATFFAPCTSASTLSASMQSPFGGTTTVVCPQFQPPSGFSIVTVGLGDFLGGGPFTTGGTITVRNNQPVAAGPFGLWALVVQELTYLDFPGFAPTTETFPVFPNPVTFGPGETIIAPVSTAWTWPLRRFTGDSTAILAYIGSGTIASRVTGNSSALPLGPNFSILDYSYTVNPAPSILYVFEPSGIPEPSSATYVALAAAAAAGLWAARRRR